MTKRPPGGPAPESRPVRKDVQAKKEKVITHHEKVQGAEELREKKKHFLSLQARDGLPNGLVEIPGPLSEATRREILNIARKRESQERERRPWVRILAVTPFDRGVAIETEDEKLAQHIADTLARSRKAEVDRVFDDEGKRRILTCWLPEARAARAEEEKRRRRK